MTGTQSEHFKVVQQSVSGERIIDEQTFFSVGVLAERLERLKRASAAFAGIELSPHADELACYETISALS